MRAVAVLLVTASLVGCAADRGAVERPVPGRAAVDRPAPDAAVVGTSARTTSELDEQLLRAHDLEARLRDGEVEPRDLDLGALLGDEDARLVSRHSQRLWLETLDRRALTVVARVCLDEWLSVADEADQPALVRAVLHHLDDVLAGRPARLPEGADAQFTEEVQNRASGCIVHWSVRLLTADELERLEQVALAESCLEIATAARVEALPPPGVICEWADEHVWLREAWRSLEVARSRILADARGRSGR